MAWYGNTWASTTEDTEATQEEKQNTMKIRITIAQRSAIGFGFPLGLPLYPLWSNISLSPSTL
ncbi:MAG: hypothetical protein ABIQ72_02715, partial [Usitatibacter sp.]